MTSATLDAASLDGKNRHHYHIFRSVTRLLVEKMTLDRCTCFTAGRQNPLRAGDCDSSKGAAHPPFEPLFHSLGGQEWCAVSQNPRHLSSLIPVGDSQSQSSLF